MSDINDEILWYMSKSDFRCCAVFDCLIVFRVDIDAPEHGGSGSMNYPVTEIAYLSVPSMTL